jgi:hypothetical protein
MLWTSLLELICISFGTHGTARPFAGTHFDDDDVDDEDEDDDEDDMMINMMMMKMMMMKKNKMNMKMMMMMMMNMMVMMKMMTMMMMMTKTLIVHRCFSIFRRGGRFLAVSGPSAPATGYSDFSYCLNY